MLEVFLSCSPPYIMRQGLSLSPELMDVTTSWSTSPGDLGASASPPLGFQMCASTPTPFLFFRCWGSCLLSRPFSHRAISPAPPLGFLCHISHQCDWILTRYFWKEGLDYSQHGDSQFIEAFCKSCPHPNVPLSHSTWNCTKSSVFEEREVGKRQNTSWLMKLTLITPLILEVRWFWEPEWSMWRPSYSGRAMTKDTTFRPPWLPWWQQTDSSTGRVAHRKAGNARFYLSSHPLPSHCLALVLGALLALHCEYFVIELSFHWQQWGVGARDTAPGFHLKLLLSWQRLLLRRNRFLTSPQKRISGWIGMKQC